MSRLGKKPIPLPSGVKVEVKGQMVSTNGPKGSLSWEFPSGITVAVDTAAACIRVERQKDNARDRALHGLTRALINNMVVGVEKGYERKLEIYGTGYSCGVDGQNLLLNCGYMGRGFDKAGKPTKAQFVIPIPKDVKVTIESPTARGESDPARMTITGPDKQVVGQFAAEIRGIRPPEPYKGKGVRYAGEVVRRKQGKAFAGGGG